MKTAYETEPEVQTTVSQGLTESERALARIWADVLRLPAPETDTNFFDAGGDSLKAMELISRVSEELGVDLPLMAFFEAPTISHLAAVIDELKGNSSTSAITRVPGRTIFPLSYSQQVFWLLEQQNPGTGLYNTARIFRIRGSVDVPVLERSLNELRLRHEILRVRLVHGSDGPVQIVESGLSLKLATAELSELRAEAKEEAASKLLLETIREPFDLATGPAMRARLIRLGAADSLLGIAIHHAVSDGFTGSILLDELCTIYDAFRDSQPHSLPPPELHFTDYAAWEREWMTGSLLERELEHWQSVLAGAPSSLDFPFDFARPSEPDRLGRQQSVTLPVELLQQVQSLAKANGATLFTALAAAFRILLFRWSGQGDFLLGTVASNRSHAGDDRMIGCFVNPLALRNQLSGSEPAREVLKKETGSVMEAFAHQDCPFTKVVEVMNPERTSNDNPLFNTAFLLQNFPVIERHGRNFFAEHVNFDANVALLDLRFIAMETRDGLQVTCEYKNRLFRQETIDSLLEAYAGVLHAITNHPEQQVSEIAIPQFLIDQAALARKRDDKQTVVIASSFTAELVQEPLTFLLDELGMNYRVRFAPYQQILQQLLDPASLLRAADGFQVVLARFEDWLHGEIGNASAAKEKLQSVAGELINALRAGQQGLGTLIVCFCPPSRRVSGDPEFAEWLRSLEVHVANALADNPATQVIRSAETLDVYSVAQYQDEYAERLGNVPYTADFFAALGTMLARRIWGIAENHYAAIAIDCDGVLWRGTCSSGQDVVVNESHLILQRALLKQRDSGVLLCLCTRNDEKDVWAAFDSNPSMPLQRDDFVSVATNPCETAENLKGLADDLGLNLDSFIYLHADPAESGAIEASCPEVLNLQSPADPDEIPAWLRHVWAFDRSGRQQQ